MMLAEYEITIRIAGATVFLRPTLRAAMRLERAYGGFDKIVDAILAENVTVMAAVIRESEDQRSELSGLIESLAGMPLFAAVEALKTPLIRHVLQLAGNDGDGADQDAKGEPVPFAQHYARLYRIATGWLGWTPETAWTATPAEISEAFKGRTEMLRAIFGGADANEIEEPDAQSAEMFNSKLSAVLAMASARFAHNGEAL